MSDVLPSNIKIREANVIKHKDPHHGSYKNTRITTIRKSNTGSTTSLQLSEFDQKKKPSNKRNSNYDEKIHQKVIDLEDQICVMKKQHVLMLDSLHKEIESLKTKNKGKHFFLNQTISYKYIFKKIKRK